MRDTIEGATGGRSDPPWAADLFDRFVMYVVVCWTSAILIGLVVCGGAWAATGHEFVSSVSEAPLGTVLVRPTVIAVDGTSGSVFVGDGVSGYVDVFGPSGEYVTRFGDGVLAVVGVAVDEATGDVYVADAFKEGVLVYAPDGKGGYVLVGQWFGEATPGKAFGELAGVAVDNSNGPSAGDLYVVEARVPGAGGGAVDVFKPRPDGYEEGTFVKRLAGVKMEAPNGVAVSSGTGRVLVADGVKGAIFAFSSEGVYEEKMNGKGSPYGPFGKEEAEGDVAGLAVDGVSGDVYVAEAERGVVSQYSSSGVWQGWITSTATGDLGVPRSVGLSGAGDVYVADAGLAVVDHFGPGMVVPSVVTGKVAKAKLARTTAVLPGTINGEGKAAEYRFEYGETPGLGSVTSSQTSGTGEVSVSVEVTKLAPGETYYYRIVGENQEGASKGSIRSFQTPAAVAELSTGAVKEVQPESVTVTGALNPEGLDTHYFFQWGVGTAYGNTTPVPPGIDAGSGAIPVEAKTVLAGLSPNSTYHYRLMAENEYGTTYGQDETFTTSGPPRICAEPTTAIGQHEATIHACVNPDQFATAYRFEYGETTGYGQEAPLGGQSIGSGSSPVALAAVLTGLNVGTTYHFRVVAENEAGVTTGPDQTFTTTPSAPVDAMFVTKISDSEAVLHAQINPLGDDTHYYFQYGTQSCQANPAGCTSIPTPPGQDIGASTTDVAGEAKLTGLSLGTIYYYRAIATNALGTTEGPERTFTTQQQPGSFTLADNRAWEMVTPPDKGGAPVETLTKEGGIIRASEDGNTLTYVVKNALGEEAEGNRSPEMQQILASRGGSAWSSKDIATPNTEAKGIAATNPPEYQFFTPNLSLALDEPAEPGPAPPLAPGVTQSTPYLRDNATNTFLPLVTEANTPSGTQFGGRIRFLSATADLSHVVITSSVALTGPESSHGLYEWSGGQLQYVSVRPNGRVPAGEVELGFFNRVVFHAISEDGSRVFWSKKEENSGRGRLYMRDVIGGRTIRLDVAQGVAEPLESSAQFQAASSGGARVFFTDRQRLTPDSTTETGGAETMGKPDLYECEIVEVAGKLTCELTDLTVDHNNGEHAAVQYFLFGASEDGSTLYLVAQGVLAENKNGNGEAARAGGDNLYELHFDGAKWTTTFIATLAGEDSPEWEGGKLADTAYLTARVSPDGRYLAFMSAAPVTGYDNVDASTAAKGARDEEVFLYDSSTATLRCVSCNPSGGRPAGVLDIAESGEGVGLLVDRRKVWGEVGHEHWLAGSIPGWTSESATYALFQSRALSDQGRVFFNSPDSLVPAAKNGKEDVYEYEPSGVGSCQSASGGCVSLISGGGSDRESAFLEATPDGSNVFFLTETRLLPQDTDTAFDIYDARECSEASPCLTPPESPPVPCAEVETCRPAEPAQPILGKPAVGTGAFTGPANPVTHVPIAKQETKARKTSKPLSRARKLKRALKRCHKRHVHSTKKRKACQRRAGHRYGRHAAKKSTTRLGKRKARARRNGR
jgi:hypothetical protein